MAAAIAQTPNLDGPAAARNAARYTTASALARLTGRGLLDSLRGLVHADPLLVPLVGEPGTVALLSTPDAVADGGEALNPGNRYPDWPQAVAARSALAVSGSRPGRYAGRVCCPLLVVVSQQDRSAPPGPAYEQRRPHPAESWWRFRAVITRPSSTVTSRPSPRRWPSSAAPSSPTTRMTSRTVAD